MLCYKKCKTIEFRFLRPTYNFGKIMLWLYIFNGILLYAEKMFKDIKSKDNRVIIRKLRAAHPGLIGMMKVVYPEPIAKNIEDGIQRLRFSVINQENNGDFIGKETPIEDALIDPNKVF